VLGYISFEDGDVSIRRHILSTSYSPIHRKITLTFHQTTDVPLSAPIKSYIAAEYEDLDENFDADCQSLESLRSQAISATDPHVNNVKKLQSYVAQLVWLLGRFPEDVIPPLCVAGIMALI
jgi:BRO1-like domain-containing protein